MSAVIPECRADTDPDVMYEALDEAVVASSMEWRTGANATADDWRYGIGQEENQHLSKPAADAFALPEAVRDRLGFSKDNGDGGLGFYDLSVLVVGHKRDRG